MPLQLVAKSLLQGHLVIIDQQAQFQEKIFTFLQKFP